MGQKVNPHGIRVGVIKDWDSKWYADADFADCLVEDYQIREYLKKKCTSQKNEHRKRCHCRRRSSPWPVHGCGNSHPQHSHRSDPCHFRHVIRQKEGQGWADVNPCGTVPARRRSCGNAVRNQRHSS